MQTKLEQLLQQLDKDRVSRSAIVPPQKEAHQIADDLVNFLFPVHGQSVRPAEVQYVLLTNNLKALLLPILKNDENVVQRIVATFFDTLPAVYQALMEDANAIFEFDPAATCLEEVIATYPGFYAIATYRIAHELQQLSTPLLPRIFTEYVHGKTGIDIHPGAKIGSAFFIDHGTGVVIGETTVIGNNVKLYQGVTLGALQVEKSMANVKRHPTIENNCIIYANSTILGGKTVIGHDSIIGGNTWLTESVPPNSIVQHQAQVKVRKKR